MGYCESVCQLCGISFAICRIRRAEEPPEAAWSVGGDGFVDSDECAEGSGCQLISRDDGLEEHVAGPGCISGQGYSAYRVSVEEMKGCRAIQCLLRKDKDWKPEPDDQDFETNSNYFLTGVGDGSPDASPAVVTPIRHGIEEVWVFNIIDGPFDSTMGLPIHPTCLEIFKRISMERFGKVSLHALWWFREIDGTYEKFFEKFPRGPEVHLGNEQWWWHEAGSEFLACNPVDVPGLPLLMGSCRRDFSYEGHNKVDYNVHEGVFHWRYKGEDDHYVIGHSTPPPFKGSSNDPFLKLPNELLFMIIKGVAPRDIANLRLTTRAYRQLPVILFRDFLIHDMPWLWELYDLPIGNTQWYRLYEKIKFCTQNLKGLQNRKRIWKDITEIVTRIERYKKEGKIPDE